MCITIFTRGKIGFLGVIFVIHTYLLHLNYFVMSSILGESAAGAAAGGAIGSIFPGVGNSIGAGIGAGVGALTGVANKLFNPNKENRLAPSSLLDDTYVNLGRLGNKKQTRAMDSEARLAALQQYYARQNNQQDMQNTYALTRDSALLEAQGKRNAGLSLAGDGSTSIASTPDISSPSLPSAPMADDSTSEIQGLNFLKDVSSLLSQFDVNNSTSRKNNAEAATAEIDNQTENDKRLAELEKLRADGDISRAEYHRRKNQLYIEQSTAVDKIEQEHQATLTAQYQAKINAIKVDEEDLQKQMMDITKQMNQEQLKQLQFVTQHQQERFDKEMEEIASRIDLNSKQGEAALATAVSAYADKAYKETLNTLEKAKVPFAREIASATSKTIKNNCNTAYWQAKSEQFNYANNKAWNNTWSYGAGQHARNLFGGWLPFGASYSVSKKVN